jgi:hypothetical protein
METVSIFTPVIVLAPCPIGAGELHPVHLLIPKPPHLPGRFRLVCFASVGKLGRRARSSTRILILFKTHIFV